MTELKPHPLEVIPAGEVADIERVTEMQIAIMKQHQDPSKRGQHPKQQTRVEGCLL